MTYTEQFIEDAIAGGFEAIDPVSGKRVGAEHTPTYFDAGWQTIEESLLDPAAWKAVGRTRRWDTEIAFTTLNQDDVLVGEDAAFFKNRDFIEHLWGGKSIEDALRAISD